MRAQLPEHMSSHLLSGAGVDCDSFPPILTEAMGSPTLHNQVIPLEPWPDYPEAIRIYEEAMVHLLGQLDQAQPDALGRRSACCLINTRDSRGSLWRFEHIGGYSETDIHDSFDMAVDSLPEDGFVYTALSLVVGNAAKDKNAAPSARSFHRLRSRLCDVGQLVIVQKDDLDMARRVPVRQLNNAFRHRESMPAIKGETDLEAYVEAAHYTVLSPRECELMAVLHRIGLGNETSLYLTGSSVGYGATAAVHPGQDPNDLDVIAIGPEGREALEGQFSAIVTAFYGSPFTKANKVVRQVGTGKLIEACVLKNAEAGVSIDLFAGKQLGDALFRPETLENNLMVQIS